MIPGPLHVRYVATVTSETAFKNVFYWKQHFQYGNLPIHRLNALQLLNAKVTPSPALAVNPNNHNSYMNYESFICAENPLRSTCPAPSRLAGGVDVEIKLEELRLLMLKEEAVLSKNIDSTASSSSIPSISFADRLALEEKASLEFIQAELDSLSFCSR